MSKRIVIIGGMGPQASVELHRRLIAHATMNGAADNHDYPEVVHISLPVRDFIDDESARPAALERIIGTLHRVQPWPRRYLHFGMQHRPYTTA